jgi:hypothetical protein
MRLTKDQWDRARDLLDRHALSKNESTWTRMLKGGAYGGAFVDHVLERKGVALLDLGAAFMFFAGLAYVTHGDIDATYHEPSGTYSVSITVTRDAVLEEAEAAHA